MEDNETEETMKNEGIEFKKPILFGRVGKLPKKVKNEAEKDSQTQNVEKPVENKTEQNAKNSLPPAVLLKELSTPIPYKEPKWSGLCPDGSDYALEVLKSGMIVEKIDLTTKPYYVFGRLANCDIVMAHPTISRHHAVLQYKAFAEENEPAAGWYLYELGSTHGTFLNRERVKNGHYTRVRVGHQIKFGNSTRTYIMLGPDFDAEGESELTVTEIKKRAEVLKAEKERVIREDKEQRVKDRLEEERKRDEQGIDWGMGEDAEDEPDLAENPYASTANEELFLEDPKKTLRGYYEREGHELTYDCQERGIGQFLCRVELPMDDSNGRPVVAEVIHRGKKKEAVIACALEACRMLDRVGLLRQAKHESRRRKQRDWSADDYYDSDEDTFLDRTGAVEKKRKARMQRLGAADVTDDKPLTYDGLLKQITEIEEKIVREDKILEGLRSEARSGTEGGGTEDALDAYMTTLKHGTMAQKAEISKTKMVIQKLKTELAKTKRLADLARPAHLLPLLKKDSKPQLRLGSNSVLVGKRIRLKEDAEKKPKVREQKRQEESEFVEEMDSDEEELNNGEGDSVNNVTDESGKEGDSKTEERSKIEIEDKNKDSSDRDSESKLEKSSKGEIEDKGSSKNKDRDSQLEKGSKRKGEEEKRESEKDSSRVFGPMRPPEDYIAPEGYFDQISDRDLPEIEEKDDF